MNEREPGRDADADAAADVLRISDGDRDSAVTALSEHLSAGRIDLGEFEDRSARVTAARTRGELTAVFADLPAPRPEFGEPAPAPAPAAAEPGAAVQVLPYLLPVVAIAAIVAMFIWAPGFAWLVLIFGAPLVVTQVNRLRTRGEPRAGAGEQAAVAVPEDDFSRYPAPDPGDRVDHQIDREYPAPDPSERVDHEHLAPDPTRAPDEKPHRDATERPADSSNENPAEQPAGTLETMRDGNADEIGEPGRRTGGE